MLKRPLRRGYPHPKRIETDVWEELVAVVSLAVHDLILLPTDQGHYRYTTGQGWNTEISVWSLVQTHLVKIKSYYLFEEWHEIIVQVLWFIIPLSSPLKFLKFTDTVSIKCAGYSAQHYNTVPEFCICFTHSQLHRHLQRLKYNNKI